MSTTESYLGLSQTPMKEIFFAKVKVNYFLQNAQSWTFDRVLNASQYWVL